MGSLTAFIRVSSHGYVMTGSLTGGVVLLLTTTKKAAPQVEGAAFKCRFQTMLDRP